MQLDRYICNFLLLLIVMYYGQGIVYPIGGLISQSCLILLMSISSIYFVKEVFLEKEKFSLFIKAWTCLLILNIIGFFWKGEFEHFGMLQSILLNMLPFYTFYYFSKRGLLTRDKLIVFLLLCLPIFAYRFQQSNTNLQMLLNRENVVDNTIYYFLGLIPFVFLFNRKSLSIVSLVFIWIFIVQSAKRAAIICGAYGIFLFYYYQAKVIGERENIRLRIINYGFTLVILFGLSYWGYKYLLVNDYLLLRLNNMLEGDSSGRDGLNRIVFASWYNSETIWELLFGHGFATSGDITSNVSHNDWLDLLVSFGVLGIGVYFLIFYGALREVVDKKWVFDKKIAFICTIGIGLVVSLTSRWYSSSFAYSQMLLLPYLLATKSVNKK